MDAETRTDIPSDGLTLQSGLVIPFSLSLPAFFLSLPSVPHPPEPFNASLLFSLLSPLAPFSKIHCRVLIQ